MIECDKPSSTSETSIVAPTPDLVINIVSGDELEAYEPDQRYWMLRDLLRTAPDSIPAAREPKPRLVIVRIEFRNSSQEPFELAFDNAAHTAELLNLEVYDDLEAAIPPVSRMHILRSAHAKTVRSIPPEGKHAYDLVGEAIEGWLVFPGAKYRIPRNGILFIRFKYGTKVSNGLFLNLQDPGSDRY